ncbi:tubulin-specific chaperone C [Astyanax mexicanus]|uniref:Tubulin-specific chaperone C n=1 Tax=Astyanax mexicanus TaxID=7994 RepID=A0A8B9KMT9_ASTMX|nr:tubulin-specific chaperone C [Astyanax mexicanus]
MRTAVEKHISMDSTTRQNTGNMEVSTVEAGSSEPVRVPESVLRRDQERQEELERRRTAKESQSVSEENVAYFSATFSAEKAAIEELISGCSSAEQGKTTTAVLEEAILKTQQLQKFLNDSTMFLTQYELRQAQASLQKLQASIAELKPKKKFAFRPRNVGSGSSQQPAATPVSSGCTEKPGTGSGGSGGAAVAVVDGTVRVDTGQCGFSNAQNEVLIRRSDEIQQRDVLLSHLTNCKVRLFGSPSTLHIKNIQNCQILSGPVSSSVFIDECSGSILGFACQQLRTHNTTDSQIYLHVTSRAIIEDCQGVQFAPFSWTYEGMDNDFTISGLDPNRNNWSQVDDFNWLAAGMPSPNWNVIPEAERISSWDTAEPTS